jgi:Domain of unknown function (DUF4037)
MTTIGTDATSWSAERRALAAKLAGDCRPDLGQAVLITGSVARGIADHYSDLEMRFLVEALQPISVYHDWLRSANGMVELEENAEHVGGTRTKSWHSGVFVESLWLPWSVLDATLGAVIRAETTNHWKLTEAWHIAGALPLREHGRLTIWQERLQNYPDALRDRLIMQTVATWSAPAWWPTSVVSVWPLVARDARLALADRLTGYLERGLRILFALNRRWEPDFKWLTSEAPRLTIKPGELVSRVNSALTFEHPRESVRTCLALLIDILTLASEEYDVSAAREQIKQALDENHLPPARGLDSEQSDSAPA